MRKSFQTLHHTSLQTKTVKLTGNYDGRIPLEKFHRHKIKQIVPLLTHEREAQDSGSF